MPKSNAHLSATTLWIATRKGAWKLSADGNRRNWALSGPQFLGHIVHHVVIDPRAPKRLVAAVKAGHLGPTVFRSENAGRTWREATKPPAFPVALGEAVEHSFWLTPGLACELGVWWAGTSPQGLFRSEDHGATWQSVDGFNLHPERRTWIGGPQEAPPGGGSLHSITLDPRDPKRLLIGMSCGGIFESLDAGAQWRPMNQGIESDFIPTPDTEYGQDIHCLRASPANPDRLYHQNHCGVYRLDAPERRWQRIGKKLPKSVGDVGFPIALHAHDPDTVWVSPMDASSVWPRVAIGGKPAVYRSRNGGKTWQRLDEGLPTAQAWWTIKRQAMVADRHIKAGLYLGTTSGEVWASRDEGDRWQNLTRHLPEIYSLDVWVG